MKLGKSLVCGPLMINPVVDFPILNMSGKAYQKAYSQVEDVPVELRAIDNFSYFITEKVQHGEYA